MRPAIATFPGSRTSGDCRNPPQCTGGRPREKARNSSGAWLEVCSKMKPRNAQGPEVTKKISKIEGSLGVLAGLDLEQDSVLSQNKVSLSCTQPESNDIRCRWVLTPFLPLHTVMRMIASTQLR